MEARTKPRLLFYCQHSVGIGHLMRSMLLARRLSERFHVLFLNGGPLPPGVAVPSEVELIDLPPLGMVDGHELISREAHTDLSAAKAQRRALVLEVFRRCAPRALLIELFPFGRKKFAFELLPLLKAARRSTPTPPLTLCSVRDILVAARPDQQHHDDRAAWLCRRYFDAVLVHADPRLARLGESFRPRRALSTPLYYTGFVAPQSQSRAVQRGEHALVSAGGGLVGGPLLRTAIEAHKRLPRTARRAMRVVAGPFLPEGDWRALQVMAHAEPDIELVRSVPALAVEMHQAALSISQCGYNTAMDIL
ncbi:MAG TPA: hypothetical protein VFB54_17850, partial [Burkholderiales bacterium]|nr:hypothetical protein [Burkholderiales bacterium]